MKRIRYINQSDGSAISLQTLKGITSEYKSIIHPDGKVGEIIDAITGDVVETVMGTSKHKTKIALKKVLMSKGVSFNEEKRMKRGQKTFSYNG